MQPIQKIVVIGATGMLGRPVAQALIQAGFAVTILARNATKAKAMFPQANIMSGDLKDTSSLIKAFSGQHAVYCNLNLPQSTKPDEWLTEREGTDNIIEAASQANISCIGFISSLVMNYQGMNNFNWWVFDVKKEAARKIKQSGVASLIFYPSTFMDNFLYTYRRGKRILLAGTSVAPMYYIAGEDFGRQVAKAFEQFSGQSKEYAVQGPQAYTADQAAKIFIDNYTKEKLAVAKAPLGLLKFLGTFNQQVHYGACIVEALNNYPEEFTAQQTWDELGKPKVSLWEFAQKHS
jgi:uncharacterized protein YbjT (DUF2867 family)